MALAIAFAVVAIYIATTSGTDRQQYAAMFDFGDSILFLAVFVIAAIPATAAALYFLRPYRFFWTMLATGAIVTAATGIAALFGYIFQRSASLNGLAGWLALTPLRILVAPGFALLFLICAIFTPSRSARIIFFVTTATEVIAFIYVALVWFNPLRFH
jgi:hypothetical protein